MRKTGLTLLEIMISVVLLGLTLVSLANVFVSGKRYILHARSRISAAEIGKFFLEPLQMQVQEATWKEAGNPIGTAAVSPVIAGSYTIADSGINYSGEYNVSPVDGTDLRRVVLTVGWTENAPAP